MVRFLVTPKIFKLIIGITKPVSPDEHILPGNAEWIREHLGLAESVGVRQNIWVGFSTAVGSSVLSRVFKRLYYLHVLLHGRALTARYVPVRALVP